jgi:hypothetical protein
MLLGGDKGPSLSHLGKMKETIDLLLSTVNKDVSQME